jgi:NAD(P)-dependent dehydrogenase (short-subunit alcohol dehydrogenase family)
VDEIKSAKPDINVKSLKIDLASFKSVREAAETVNGWADVPRIDVLVNNAGIMATPFSLTEDGIENQFQSNHLGPFLFTNLIMHKILASPSPRVVVVTSNGHRFGGIRWYDVSFSDGKYYDPFKAYAQSKTANNLFAIGLASRLGKRGLFSFSMHPGVVLGTSLAVNSYTTPDQFLKDLAVAEAEYGTKFNTGFPQSELKSNENSVATHILTAFSPDIATEELNGKYFLDARIANPWEGETYAWASSKIDAERLWKLSEKMVGQEFTY